MSTAQTAELSPPKPLRLWPGVAAATILLLFRFIVPAVMPEAILVGMFTALVCILATLLWWAFFSRAPRSERWGGLLLLIGIVAATSRLVDKSVATGAQGVLFYMYAVPAVCIAFVVWAVATRRITGSARWVTMAAVIALASGAWALLRTDGITGTGGSSFHWRWSRTPEERLVAETAKEPAPTPPTSVPSIPAVAVSTASAASVVMPPAPSKSEKAPDSPPEWPGFRGSHRDGVIPGVQIATDWTASPPALLWRKPIGPGWSSFAVWGNLIYTQEQRGEHELVACYNKATGKLVWTHRDSARFWESNGGAGPRATPTLDGSRVYTLGATGILNALDAVSGAVFWTRNAAADTNTKVPGWGFSGSPLIMDGAVIIALGGRLAAYESATGEPRWTGPLGGGGYSSPHRITIGGADQVLLMSGSGATSFSPVDGAVLWKFALPPASQIVQPSQIPDGDLLVGGGDTTAMRRISVTHGPGGFAVEERWRSIGLKPYFSDFVVHKGHAIGFDGSILSSIDLKDGKRAWKGGRYGQGQLVLLPDQDLLLVISEQGELALVSAAADQFKEIAKVPGITGKTWNHPVLVGDTLLVRNSEEMAAFRLSPAHR